MKKIIIGIAIIIFYIVITNYMAKADEKSLQTCIQNGYHEQNCLKALNS